MTTRGASVLMLLAAATTASADPTVTLTWHWRNMTTGDQTPLSPGDAAAVWLNVSFTPAVNSLLPDGTRCRGLHRLFADLVPVGDSLGSWTLSGTTPVPFPGTPEIDGPWTNVPEGWVPFEPMGPLHWGLRYDLILLYGYNITGGQGFYQPLGSATNPPGTVASIQPYVDPHTTSTHTVNPINEIWRGMFAPDSYTPRDIVWQPRKAEASPGTGAWVLSQSATFPFPRPLPYIVPEAGIDWGTLSIPVVPGPGAMSAICIAMLLSVRRQRERTLGREV